MVAGSVVTPATQSVVGMLRVDCCHGPSTRTPSGVPPGSGAGRPAGVMGRDGLAEMMRISASHFVKPGRCGHDRAEASPSWRVLDELPRADLRT